MALLFMHCAILRYRSAGPPPRLLLLLPQGQYWAGRILPRTTYLPIWPPVSFCSEMPHYCRVHYNSRAKYSSEEFDNIKHIERSPIRISLFYYDTTFAMYLQPQTVHKHTLTEITEFAAIFGGMLTVATCLHSTRIGSTVGLSG